MSIDYLSEIWVVGKSAYSSISEAKKNHPSKEPRLVIYRDKCWPAPYSPEREAGPVSYKQPVPKESLRTILERCWSSWEKKYGE